MYYLIIEDTGDYRNILRASFNNDVTAGSGELLKTVLLWVSGGNAIGEYVIDDVDGLTYVALKTNSVNQPKDTPADWTVSTSMIDVLKNIKNFYWGNAEGFFVNHTTAGEEDREHRSTHSMGVIKDHGTITVSPLEIDSEDGNFHAVEVDVDLTLNAVAHNVAMNCALKIELTQEGITGGHPVIFGTNFETPGGVTISVSTAAGKKDLLIFESGTNGKYMLVSHTKSQQ